MSKDSENRTADSQAGRDGEPREAGKRTGGLSRRSLLVTGALAGAGATLAAAGKAEAGAGQAPLAPQTFQENGITDVTIAELQARMSDGRMTSVSLTNRYLARIQTIDRTGPTLTSVIETNPDAVAIARALDRERDASGPRGPLHGIPILLKDNIDTADGMDTAAGSLGLVGRAPLQDSTVAARLRAAGAVILGKAGLSEWANFRGFESSSGWSGRGGQVKNPYILDRNPCGSSSGSAAATSASLTAAALGTETDGSIVCPSSANGVVGIKPTVGLTSRAGVVPISSSQDTVGPHGRTVADAASVLGALTGVDPRDPATQASAGNSFTDYTQFLDSSGLAGASIGVIRDGFAGFTDETNAIYESAIEAMADAGATIVDPADFLNLDDLFNDPAEIIVLVYEYKRDLNAYLATRRGVPIDSLAGAISFNLAHADEELKWFGQEWMELAEAEIFTEAEYNEAVVREREIGGRDGIDAALAAYGVDALVAPTGSPAWPTDLVSGDAFQGGSSTAAAMAGYPLVSVPAGYAFGLPVGISFMASAWSEPLLIKLASGFEAATRARQTPTYLPTLPVEDPRTRRAPVPRASQADRAKALLARALDAKSYLRRRPHSI